MRGRRAILIGMMSVPRSPQRCTEELSLSQGGPHRLFRTCLRYEGHAGEHDFGIKIPKQEELQPGPGHALLAGSLLLAALAVMVFLALFLTPDGSAAPADKAPRCAVQNVSAPRILGKNQRGQRFIWAEFVNKCLDPVMEMGAFACLEEIATPGGPPKVVDCHANIDRTPFTLIVPHETNVFMVAKCNYTTIPRFYKVTGYAWAVSLPTDSVPPEMKYYKSRNQSSKVVHWAKNAPGDVHFCDISPAGTSWRNFR